MVADTEGGTEDGTEDGSGTEAERKRKITERSGSSDGHDSADLKYKNESASKSKVVYDTGG
jgi:hypothetical protein